MSNQNIPPTPANAGGTTTPDPNAISVVPDLPTEAVPVDEWDSFDSDTSSSGLITESGLVPDSVITEDTEAKKHKHIPVSKTVLELDKWSLRKGAEWSEELNKAGVDIDELSSADLRAVFYDFEPHLAEKCENQLRQEFVNGLLNNPDIQEVRENTVLNEEFTRLAFEKTSKEWVEVVAKVKQQQAEGKCDANGNDKDGGMMPNVMAAALKGAAKAMNAAKDANNQMKDSCMAAGIDPGELQKMSKVDIANTFKKVANDPKLQQIAKMAGKLKLVAKAQQRKKTVHGMDDVVNVMNTNDINNLLPSELTSLVDEDLEWDTLRRLAENSTLGREWKSKKDMGKGPIFIYIDESGSMAGPKETSAKALCITIATVARNQKRWCSITAFSSRGQRRTLTLPPGKWDSNKVLDWMINFLNGGTEPDFYCLPKLWEECNAPKGKTDMVIITDGECYISQEEQDFFKKWKHDNECKVTGLFIQADPGVMGKMCDETFKMNAITTTDAGVEAVLGV
jgi:uncharacterized protein with von Willebrand factor type A (vWA) domain